MSKAPERDGNGISLRFDGTFVLPSRAQRDGTGDAMVGHNAVVQLPIRPACTAHLLSTRCARRQLPVQQRESGSKMSVRKTNQEKGLRKFYGCSHLF
jgi:hypothetical protein